MYNLKAILQALLMSSTIPLTIERMLSAFADWEKPEILAIKSALDELATDYADTSVELVSGAVGYYFRTKPEYASWISRMLSEKPPKYSSAILETLAIIAYKQPVTRADIEHIRGVSLSSSILRTLLDREWIREIGTRDVPGKPTLFGTTKAFLDYFNLQSLNDLPALDRVEDE